MKRFLIFLSSFWVLLLPLGCKKEKLETYNGGNAIVINGIDSVKQTSIKYANDTFNFNFSFLNNQDSTFIVSVASVGFVTNNQRTFDLKISSINGTEGRDYIIVNKDSNYIPAMSNSQFIRVKVVKNNSYLDSSFILNFDLLANTNFETNFLPSFAKTSDSAYLIHRVLKISNIIIKPSLWDANSDVLGIFTSRKLTLFVQTMNLVWANFYKTSGNYTKIELTNFSRSFQDSLKKWKNDNKTVFEKDGSIMQMGPLVQ